MHRKGCGLRGPVLPPVGASFDFDRKAAAAGVASSIGRHRLAIDTTPAWLWLLGPPAGRSMTWVAPQVRSAQPCPFAVFARRSRVPVTRRRRSDRDSGCRTPPAPRRRGLDRSHSRRRRGSWLRRRDQTRGALVRSSSRDGELHVPTRRALQECRSVKLLVPVFFKKKKLVSCPSLHRSSFQLRAGVSEAPSSPSRRTKI
jgi:hypothetical protein